MIWSLVCSARRSDKELGLQNATSLVGERQGTRQLAIDADARRFVTTTRAVVMTRAAGQVYKFDQQSGDLLKKTQLVMISKAAICSTRRSRHDVYAC